MNIKVTIAKTFDKGNVVAIADATFDNSFVVRGFRIMQGEKGAFIAMPNRASEFNGETKYRDVFYPITAEARAELRDAILQAYDEQVPDYEPDNEPEITEHTEIKTDEMVFG